MIPVMTLAALCQLPVKPFPKGAGWRYQQLIKYSFTFHQPEVPNYLIWAADPIRFARSLFTHPKEKPCKLIRMSPPCLYCESYQRLFREEPPLGLKSFIAQHMMIKKAIAQEMLTKIDTHSPGKDPCAWKLMRSLRSKGLNLFGEYETYGWYSSLHYPDQISRINFQWLRDGISHLGYPPTSAKLVRLSASFDYTSFVYYRASCPSLFCRKKAIG